MVKIKYQGGLTKFIACRIGEKNKRLFADKVNYNLSCLKSRFSCLPIQITLVSFSSSKDFYEQILSILSFLRYVGTPTSWTIYSDGSHSLDQIQLLTSSFSFVRVESINFEKAGCKEELIPYKDCLLHYAKSHPLGKKLFSYLNYYVVGPTLFLDSDILFYSQAVVLRSIIEEKVNGWYLPDADWGCLDTHYISNNTRQLYQVNSGFILMNKNLTNVNEGLEFLKHLNFNYHYFSEQTVMHILLMSNSFIPLDNRIFILNNEDQFDFSYVCSKKGMAIRHYTGPVRHKMWQRDWKWQLSIIN
jgi:hypothetical protein